MHFVLFLALLQAAQPEPRATFAVTVIDPTGAIVNDATVVLRANRCTEWCEQPIPQERLEARTVNGVAVFHPQAGVIYDMLVTKCGMAPHAAAAFVLPHERRGVQVTLQRGTDMVRVEVCSDCPMVEMTVDPMELMNLLRYARIPVKELPRLCLD